MSTLVLFCRVVRGRGRERIVFCVTEVANAPDQLAAGEALA
jgi:hypothetical protein